MRLSPTFLRVGLALGLVAAVLALGGAVLASAAPDTGVISGAVASPGGYPLPSGTLVKLFEPGSDTVRGMAVPDVDDGAFTLPGVPNGLYVVKAVPPEISAYTQSEPRPVAVINAPVDIGVISLTHPQIVGTVTAPGGVNPAPADVFVYLRDGRLFQHVDAPTGNYQVGGLRAGGYFLQAYPASDDPFWRSPRAPLTVTAVTTYTLDLHLSPAQLWGTVVDGQGNPKAGATVIATHPTGEHHSDLTSLSGYWAIGGLPAGKAYLVALPPWPGDGLLRSDVITTTLPTVANPYTLTLNTSPKVLNGSVETQDGQPVVNARVVARRANPPGQAEATTDADGSYEMNLASGLWALTVRPISDTLPADWTYPQPPQLVFFAFNNHPESRTQDFTVLVADSQVTGLVMLPDGLTPPTFTVTVSLHNDEGVGRHIDIATDGSFSLALPSGGYKVDVFPHDPAYLGPAVAPITAPSGGSADLGTLTLLARDAVITGTVTAGGTPLVGIPLVAWRPGTPGSVRTMSGPEGQYVLSVAAGDWHVQPAPRADQPYLYAEGGEEVSVTAGGSVTGVDFDLLTTDAVISGVLVDERGLPVAEAGGWAHAHQPGNPAVHNGAPILEGSFTLLVPAGEYRVAALLPPGSDFTSATNRLVSVDSGETVAITMTVQRKDASLSGWLWDPRHNQVVNGVSGLVTAWSEGSLAAAPINSGNGAYLLDVAAGLWRLNYRIDPHSDYVRLSGAHNIPVEAHQHLVVKLPVLPADALITGTVQAPSGAALPGVAVVVKGVGGEVNDLWLQTHSDAQGHFAIEVPYGQYRLGAVLPHPTWISPIEAEVTLLPGATSGGHVLRFQLPDATLSGTLTVDNIPSGGEVYVWAWSEDGGFTQGHFPVAMGEVQATGVYSLAVISDTTWHVGGVLEKESQYWIGKGEAAVGSGDTILDLILEGPRPLPAPVVATFDALEPQTISLADGTAIYIPAGAMPVSGTVTLRIVPMATLPGQQQAGLLHYGYAFLATGPDGQPIETHFNQEVTITFHYTEADLNANHVYEPWLKPAYYSTTTERWEFPESFVVDMENNQVVMQIDHFTDFALTGETAYLINLPLIRR